VTAILLFVYLKSILIINYYPFQVSVMYTSYIPIYRIFFLR